MASNGNFCTWLSTHYQGGSGSTTTFSFGSCRVGTTSGGYPRQISNFFFFLSGKWYIELNNILNNGYHVFGIINQANMAYGDGLLNGTGAYQYQAWNGQKRGNGGSASSYGSSWQSVGDVIGLAFDADNGKIWWAKNGTWQASGDPAGNSNEAFSGIDASDTYYFGWADYYSSKAGTVHINCGQDSSFGNSKTSGSANAADSNGFGDFYYTPPTGFLALCTANLPISDDIDPAQTDTNFPQKQFNTVLYTGNSSNGHAITGLGFQPDMVWFQRRSVTGTFGNGSIDSSRGATKGLYLNRTDVETDFTNDFSSFDSDGFTLQAGSSANINNSGNTFVAWCWRANGGTTSSNTDGALTSTVQANQAAGFSISKYTCNGSDSSFGHGLGAAPDWFAIKKIDNQARNWMCWHRSLATPTTGYIRLNLNNAQGNDTLWDSTLPDSTKIYVNNSTTEVNNPSGDSYICYAWRGIEGYSKFGSYEGNGNNEGPFIYTGFRPRMWFFKEIDSADDWAVYDTARDTANTGSNKVVRWESTEAEFDGTTRAVDVLSNGLKIRTSNGTINTSGSTYIYGAWGDVPFKYNNTF